MKAVAVIVILGLALAHAKVYDKCEVAKSLAQNGVQKSLIPTFVCIAKHESQFNTATVNDKLNSDKSIDYGMFQINNRYWCPANKPKGCKKSCESYIDDNINDDITCIKQIYAETKRLKGDGFLAWSTYKFCKSPAADVAGCKY